MKTYNFSQDSEYHTQINNREVPYESCNTTSCIMALKQADWPMPVDEATIQPEDALTLHLKTPEAYEAQKRLAAWSVGGHPPQEVHIVLAWGVNTWIGAEVDRFTTAATLEVDIAGTVQEGGGVVISGAFPRPGETKLRHIVSVAGYCTTAGDISHVIIDDPYGDWHTEYSSHRGNNVLLTRAEFDEIFIKDNGRCWAHLIRPRTEVV